jgi:DHA2 family multidrug resistance protein-like MFS transporter
VLDSAIATIALPTIARELTAAPAASIWVVNAYQLAVTVSLLPLASLGDIIGYRRVYAAGLGVFTAASLACALSHTLPALVIARVIQGFGGAGVMSVNTALVRFIYPRSMLGHGWRRCLELTLGVAATGAATVISQARLRQLRPTR